MSATSSTGANHYVVPFVAAMDASGAANFAYVEQELVSITGIDYEFDVQLSEANSKKLLEAFTVSGNGPAAGSTQFNVHLSSAADLQAVLASVINGADEAKNGAQSATSQLIADLHAGLTAAIGTDSLINTVENLDVTAVDVTIDASGGAAAMATGLTDDAKCDLIYTQIPAAALNLYMDASGENQVTSALPLQQGDKITFVFDVDLSDVVPVKTQTAVGATDAAGAAVPAGYTSTLHYNLASKRIAFNIQMSGSSGPFSGLKG